jgi:hypothetical protein
MDARAGRVSFKVFVGVTCFKIKLCFITSCCGIGVTVVAKSHEVGIKTIMRITGIPHMARLLTQSLLGM